MAIIEEAAMNMICPRTGKKKWRVDEIINELEKGVDHKALKTLQKTLNVTDHEMGKLVGISQKTLSRWAVKGGLIPSAAADRLYRVARILALAEEVLGNENDAITWLKGNNPFLGGKRPIEILDRDLGVKMVEEALYGIQHGMFS